ncbi:MAG: hypothetical protein RSA10_02190 [Bacilli bacterium]
MLKNRKSLIDPALISYCHLVQLVDEDHEYNKLMQNNLRCTHETFIVGMLSKDSNGKKIFIDMFSEEKPVSYLYFDDVYQVQQMFQSELVNVNHPFAILANPIADLGIKNLQSQGEMLEKLNNKGLEFSFTNKAQKQVNVLIKQIKK